MKLRVNLLLVLLLIGLVPLLMSSTVLSSYSRSELKRQLEEGVYKQLYSSASFVAQWFEYDIVEGAITKDDVNYVFMDSLKDEDIELFLFEGSECFMSSIMDGSERHEGYEIPNGAWKGISNEGIYRDSEREIVGTEYYVCYVPVLDGEGELWGVAAAAQPSALVDADIEVVYSDLMYRSVMIIVVSAWLIVVISLLIKRALTKAVKGIGQIAEGNLKAEVKASAFISDIYKLLNASRVTRDKLHEVVGGITESSGKLGRSAGEIDELSSSGSNQTEQISTAVDDMANEITKMAANVLEVNNGAVEMGELIDGVGEGVDKLSGIFEKTGKLNSESVKAMDTVMGSSSKSAEAIEKIAKQVEAMNSAISEINSITKVISDIASQTNLLSLNASIEAARAGDAGRGFAVVAEQVKMLAEQSSAESKRIQAVADTILMESGITASLAGEVSVLVGEERKDLEKARKNVKELSEGIEESISIAEGMVGQVQELERHKDVILSNVGELSATSQQNAASTEEIAASMATVAQAVGDIAKKSDKVKELSVALKEQVAYFKL